MHRRRPARERRAGDEGRPVDRPTKLPKVRRVRPHSFEFRRPDTAAEWDRYHAIRQTCLFDVYHPWIPYDRDHPDDRDPRNRPLGLFVDGRLSGTVRVDLKPGRRAIFRLVAIAEESRGHHLGSRLLELAEAYARAQGVDEFCLNAVEPAFGFYARHGYAPARWDGCTACPTSIPVMKRIVPAGAGGRCRALHGRSALPELRAG
jgi:GNAT superfamily N-acetyltransferase